MRSALLEDLPIHIYKNVTRLVKIFLSFFPCCLFKLKTLSRILTQQRVSLGLPRGETESQQEGTSW